MANSLQLFKLMRRIIWGSLCLLILLATYAIAIEPNWLKVNQLTLELDHLDPAFDGYRLVQISDIHLGDGGREGMSHQRLHRFITTVNALNPDLVAITGDFVSHSPSPYSPQLTVELSQISSPDGTVAVLGNHDHWRDPQDVRIALQNAWVKELRNDVYVLQRQGKELAIAGVDDVWQGVADLPHVLQHMPPNVAGILLAHEPDFADDSAATGQFDLQLSGHSHGGQVRLPLLPPPVLPFMAVKYPEGLYRVGDMWQYTNVGLGTMALPVRFFSRPEITVFTLRSPTRS